MFDRLARGWRLGMTAFGILRTDKKLIVFPLLSGLALIVVSVSFLLPLVLSERVQNLFADNAQNVNNNAQNVLVYVILFAFYFVSYFVIIFFNSALVACALMRFNGEEPTLGDGFRAALSRLPQILVWSLVSATVGMILRIIEDRSEKIGQFVAGLLGMAWNAVTYFVVPVLVVEKVGPFKAIQRSCAVLKKTWGESLASNFGVGLIMFGLFLLAMVPLFLGALLAGVPGAIVGGTITLALVLILALVSSAVHTIIIAALYQYAAQDRTPPQFGADTLRGAFTAK